MKKLLRLKNLSSSQIWLLALLSGVAVCGLILGYFSDQLWRKTATISLAVMDDTLDTKGWENLLHEYAEQQGSVEFELNVVGSGSIVEATVALPNAYDVMIGPQSWVERAKDSQRIQAIRSESSDESETARYAAPLYESSYYVLFYDKRKVQRAAQTWDELGLETMAQADRQAKRYGLAMSEEAAGAAPFFTAFIRDTEGRIGPMKTAEAAESIHTLADLRFKYLVTPVSCQADCAAAIFREGRAPYALAGSWRLGEFRAALGDKLGVAALPKMKEHSTLSPRSTLFLTVSRVLNPEAEEAVKTFTTWLRSPEGAEAMFAHLNKLPSLALEQSLPSSPLLQSLASAVRDSTVVLDSAAYEASLAPVEPILGDYLRGQIATGEALERLAKVDARLAPQEDVPGSVEILEGSLSKSE